MTGQRFEQRAASVGQRRWLPVKEVDLAQQAVLEPQGHAQQAGEAGLRAQARLRPHG